MYGMLMILKINSLSMEWQKITIEDTVKTEFLVINSRKGIQLINSYKIGI